MVKEPKRNNMGHFADFHEILLGDNVMNDFEKIIREMSYFESMSKISNQNFRHQLRHYNHTIERIQRQQIRRIQQIRTKHK